MHAVYVNVSSLDSGISGGSRIYSAVGNYAFNNNKVFVGDPAGLSDVALFRRTENMLSLGLKFGTTRFMRPHRKQVNNNLTAGLKWKEGDDDHNMKQLMMVSYNNIKTFMPEIDDVRYNLERGQENGGNITRTDDQLLAMVDKAIKGFKEVAKSTAKSKALGKRIYSSSSIKRAALIRTLLEREAKERGSTFSLDLKNLSRVLE